MRQPAARSSSVNVKTFTSWGSSGLGGSGFSWATATRAAITITAKKLNNWYFIGKCAEITTADGGFLQSGNAPHPAEGLVKETRELGRILGRREKTEHPTS